MEEPETCGEAAPKQHSHALDEGKRLFSTGVVSTAGIDVLDVPESMKRKGLILEEEGNNASGASVPGVNNLRLIGEEDALIFNDRNVAWILARQNFTKRNKQRRSLDFSASEVETLASEDIQNFLIEGARIGAILGQAEPKSCTPNKSNYFDTGIAGMPSSNNLPYPEAATDGAMDPLTPERVQQTRGRSAADYNSSPEPPPDPGELLSINQGKATCPKEQEAAATPKSSSRLAQHPAQEQVTKQEVQPNSTAIDKSARKRKYLPKIRAENPRPRSRAKKARVAAAEINVEIPSSPSLMQMKLFARINQRQAPKWKRRSKAAAAIVHNSPAALTAAAAPVTPNVQPEAIVKDSPGAASVPDVQDAIVQSADFLRFVHESLFGDRSEEVKVDCSTAAEDPPSTPRGAVPVASTCLDFTLVMPPWSPPSPHGTSDVADLWGNFDKTVNSHESATSVRRTLKFDAVQLVDEPPQLQENNGNLSTNIAAAHCIEIQIPEDEEEEVVSLPSVAADPARAESETAQEKEMQIVAYDEGSKRLVVSRKVPRVRRVRYKPKVNLDACTLKMFKTLTIKASGASEKEEAEEAEKASWERSRRLWQNRAHHFISVMRQVQGDRSFSRWKGSVTDSVGGAFLTQNVSDFLSSNAFIALRARFPARPRDVNVETTSTSLRKDDQPPADVQPSIIPTEASISRPYIPATYELNKELREGDDQTQEEASTLQQLCTSNEQSLSDIVEILTIELNVRCRIANTTEIAEHTWQHSASEEPAFVRKSNPALADLPELEAVTTAHSDQQNVFSLDEPLLHTNDIDSKEQDVMQPDVIATPLSWKAKRARGIIQEKFSSVVTESVSSLTAAGREKVLAATLRLVLGKKNTTRESELNKGVKHRALKNGKLRPRRAVLRSSMENYRYRQSVSFKLLSGEARANWEAGFVQKSQKAKWEPLRAAILCDDSYCRDPLTEDCVDWAAVQKASVHEVAEVIKNRGMNNALAGRMKAFLDRVHRDQNGRIDLEWIRKLPPEDAKTFLMSFRGMGIKSVECIRLLTLHHASFPVDTNVGRILVRLGWVPLEPLPEETQLHLLELYPIQSQIQQYAWPRLCTLDQKTLYELHYQMITFGKVFCTKSKPNCNACPLRTECKHYASSYASAKLLLKGSGNQEKQSKPILALQGNTSEVPKTAVPTEAPHYHSTLSPGESCVPIIELEPCIPIIEEPRSPEPMITTVNRSFIPDIEELPLEALDFEIVSIGGGELWMNLLDVQKTLLDLNREPEPETLVLPDGMKRVKMKTHVPTLRENDNCKAVVENNTTLEATGQNVDLEALPVEVPDDFKHLPSQELILLPPQASLAPAPKLKNVQRLRTVHFVYELPDNHPLLFKMDKREVDDPCFYLLAIWSPDEVPATMPKINDDESKNPFASCEDGCNTDPEHNTVRGTLLIPCKTAMRGWFPLNGTYFQVNEVFADHASSVQPIDVPRTLLWSLRRRFVYFSTAVSNLFKDMSQEEIQCCFQKERKRSLGKEPRFCQEEEIVHCAAGYVCLRAFDVAIREPKILSPRLHESGAKIVKAPARRRGRGQRRGLGERKTAPSKDQPQPQPTGNPPSEEAL